MPRGVVTLLFKRNVHGSIYRRATTTVMARTLPRLPAGTTEFNRLARRRAFPPISGMAPRARVAMYKALWSIQDGSTASGFNSDLVAAIDQAVADGVDVINYSVGPSSAPNTLLSPEQV